MLLRCILLTFLSCIFCFSTFANDECSVGYGYKITQGIGGCVDLGTLDWNRYHNDTYNKNMFYAVVDKAILDSGNTFYTTEFIYDSAIGSLALDYREGTGYISSASGEPTFRCYADKYNSMTTSEFKQAMSGVILYYQRTTDATWTPPPREDMVCNFDTSSYEPYGEYILPAIGECTLCPPNTYKDFVGNEPCTPCPNGLLSVAGATSIDQCGHVLHVDDYIVFMPVEKRTEHGLCTMLDGVKYCADVYERQ